MTDRRAHERLWQRIARAVGIGKTTTAAAEGGSLAAVQVSLNQMETLDGLQVVQQFGFASGLPVGSDVVAHFIAGDRSNGIVVGTNHPPSRPRTLIPGQTVLYDQSGTRLLLTNDGNATLTLGPGCAFRIVGNLHVTGNIVWSADSAPTDAEGHVHGGIMPGGGNTSPPIAGS